MSATRTVRREQGRTGVSRVVLVHWHEAEAAQRAERLRSFGHDVVVHWQQDGGGELTRALAGEPPDAFVIDLGRLPSHGREVATWLRRKKSLRHVPIVFVPGDAAKTERIRVLLPDAVFAPWGRLRTALARAIAASRDHSATPVWKKLGVRAGDRLVVVRAPGDVVGALGELPAGARLDRRLTGTARVVLLFCRTIAELRSDWPRALSCVDEAGGLWIAWPKQAAGRVGDLSRDLVRAFGLEQGLVDNKVCSIDGVWSALRFARRR
jgi:CheY-like chemotaxis protein